MQTACIIPLDKNSSIQHYGQACAIEIIEYWSNKPKSCVYCVPVHMRKADETWDKQEQMPMLHHLAWWLRLIFCPSLFCVCSFVWFRLQSNLICPKDSQKCRKHTKMCGCGTFGHAHWKKATPHITLSCCRFVTLSVSQRIVVVSLSGCARFPHISTLTAAV